VPIQSNYQQRRYMKVKKTSFSKKWLKKVEEHFKNALKRDFEELNEEERIKKEIEEHIKNYPNDKIKLRKYKGDIK